MDKLLNQIKEQLASKQHVFVAISGFGGSGKSHLADRLREVFHIHENQVIRLDHLYSQNPDGPGILDQVDWTLLKTVLDQARSKKQLKYIGRGFRGDRHSVDEKLPSVVIVEGIRLLQPDLLPYFDISVWIDCPQEVALKRAKDRDRAQGEDEGTVARWDTDWGPKDKAYFDTFRPDKLATFLYPSASSDL